jgi:hypothetical protein
MEIRHPQANKHVVGGVSYELPKLRMEQVMSLEVQSSMSGVKAIGLIAPFQIHAYLQ